VSLRPSGSNFCRQTADISRSEWRRLRLADEVTTLDPMNSTMAARLVQPLGAWRRHDPARQTLMRHQPERILSTPGLSTNTYEMVSERLAS
jgi:aminopeptidase N